MAYDRVTGLFGSFKSRHADLERVSGGLRRAEARSEVLGAPTDQPGSLKGSRDARLWSITKGDSCHDGRFQVACGKYPKPAR
jgi:hypothetical protein